MYSYTFPVSGGKITSNFGPRTPPKEGATKVHQGIDISVPTGTSVMSALGGVVKKAGFNSSSGNYVTVDHGGGIETTYKHLSKIIASAEGSKVSQGQVIGLSGSTGISTGPHLHFEVRKDGRYIDPLSFKGSSDFDISTSGVLEGVEMGNITDNILKILKSNWWLIAGALVVIAIIK